MKNLTLYNLTKVCSGEFHGDESLQEKTVSSITTDSRQVEEGALFVPIVGERADGHDFISQVMEKGALCTLSERVLEGANFPYIKVESSLQAVKDIAKFYLEQLDIPVVGISGSVGKTSTKEMIGSVLDQKYKVLKTKGNFNNELGLPLTVFRLRDSDQVAVLEMGISHFGEMSRLASIARPDIAVITNIGVCHLENLKDRNGVLEAKTEMFKYMKEDGVAILNGDDDKLKTIEAVNKKKPIFFGLQKENGYYADEVENHGLRGIDCVIHTPNFNHFQVHIQIPGIHMVYNALAATAVGEALCLSRDEIRAGIEACVPLGGRNNLIEANGLLIIDDCYNANPISMRSGIDVLNMAEGRKVAILGDMGELGVNEKSLHYEIGRYVVQKEIDVLIAVGKISKEIYEAALMTNGKTKLYYFPDKEELFKNLDEIVREGDTILVKASHFMGFPEVVKYLEK